MKKICFITTSRTDFGMVKIIINEAIKKKKYKTSLIISGNHNENFFGKSIKEIYFNKNLKKFMIFLKQKNNEFLTVSASFAKIIDKITLTLKKIKPHVFVAFGDRYEMLAATLSAYILNIPIVHIAGISKIKILIVVHYINYNILFFLLSTIIHSAD